MRKINFLYTLSNLVQTSFGTSTHSSDGSSLGTSFVTCSQVLWGSRVHSSLGASCTTVWVLSKHCSEPLNIINCLYIKSESFSIDLQIDEIKCIFFQKTRLSKLKGKDRLRIIAQTYILSAFFIKIKMEAANFVGSRHNC